jgi:hypothetical protein
MGAGIIFMDIGDWGWWDIYGCLKWGIASQLEKIRDLRDYGTLYMT